jgi:hypothetical protein
VIHLQIAGGDLVQHRGEEKEVVARDQGDLEVGAPPQCALEAARGVDPAEPAAHDQHAFRCVRHVRLP